MPHWKPHLLRLLALLQRYPGLIAACGDDGVLGAAFYLMEPVDGFNAAQGLPMPHAGDAAMRQRMGLAMVEAIAEFFTRFIISEVIGGTITRYAFGSST